MTENKMLPKGDLRFSCSMLMRVVVLLFSLISDFFCGVATISGIVLVSPEQYDVAQSLCKPRGEYLSVLEAYPVGPMQYCVFAPRSIVSYNSEFSRAESVFFVEKTQLNNKR